MKSIAYVGLDVHKDSISAALYVENERDPKIEKSFSNEPNAIKKIFERWMQGYDLRCCYEASSCGYVLQRMFTEMGVVCEIAAPSLIPVRPGDHYKTDRLDAKKLARLYRAGELTFIRIPTKNEESVRDLVRCRETMQKEVTRARHYILKFLQRHGVVYRDGENWTEKHWRYLMSLRFKEIEGIVWQEYLCLLQYAMNRLEDIDKKIEEIAFSDAYKEIVGKMRSLRGIATHTAMVLATEIGDFRRFASAEQMMSYVGLTPGADMSGGSSRRCSITKAGNSRCRHVLIQAAWNYRHKPAVGVRLKARQEGQAAETIGISWKAQHRLHKKYWKLANRMESKKAVVAVARELIGFIWAVVNKCDEINSAKAA